MEEISLINFLKNPKDEIGSLNGWQRIWLIFSAVIFVFHILAVLAFSPRIGDMFPDIEFKKSLVKDIEASIKSNEDKCRKAEAEEVKAMTANDEYNKLGREKAKKEVLSVVASIAEAQDRLMKLELTGKKYTDAWRATNDQLGAYHLKRLSLNWTDREFVPAMIGNDETYAALEMCKKQRAQLMESNAELRKDIDSATEEKNRFVGNIFSIIISYIVFTMAIYFIGWSVAWIRKGFAK
jgi:Fe2+ transport system protein B